MSDCVAEEHQVLAEEPDWQRRAIHGQLFGQRSGLPVAPEQLASRRAGPDAREELVLFSGQHRSFIV